MSRCHLLASLLLGAVALPASEVVRNDLNLAFEMLPTAFDYEVGDGGSNRSGSDTFKRAVGLRIGPRISAAAPGESLSWVGGVEARIGDYAYSTYGSYRTYGIGMTAGLGWAFADQWLLSLEPVVEVGLARLAFEANPAFAEVRAKGMHLAYGARLGLGYTLRRAWVFGIEGGIMGITNDLTDDQDRSMSLTQLGPVAALTIAWRWDHAPRPLE